ncbi:MAG TPA: S-layer homology domain-containing protein, partial [Candidatus Gracilibacteria bacterium]|nr:S-layer homology domain-containing protein [Candidatus Gracilibacteria bacterium]
LTFTAGEICRYEITISTNLNVAEGGGGGGGGSSGGGGGGSSGGGSSGGGSSGGGSTSSSTTTTGVASPTNNEAPAYILPASPELQSVEALSAVDLSQVKGELSFELKMENEKEDIVAVFEKNTLIKNAQGELFSGVISSPTVVKKEEVKTSKSGLKPDFVIEFGPKDGEFLTFSKPYKLIIPIPQGSDPKTVKLYFFNTQTQEYELVGDGGSVKDGYITVFIDHMTMFALIDGKDKAKTTQVLSRIFIDFFKDAKNHWAETYVKDIYELAIVDKNANFYPNRLLTRAELSKIIVTAFEFPLAKTKTNSFSDVSAEDWFAPYVLTLKNQGIIQGYADGTFLPKN